MLEQCFFYDLNDLPGLSMLKLAVKYVTVDHFNAPVVASLPHFLYADKQYLEAVDGLHPIEAEHTTDVCIEPVSLSYVGV